MDIKTLDKIAIACDIAGTIAGIACAILNYENLVACGGWIASSMWAMGCLTRDLNHYRKLTPCS